LDDATVYHLNWYRRRDWNFNIRNCLKFRCKVFQ